MTITPKEFTRAKIEFGAGGSAPSTALENEVTTHALQRRVERLELRMTLNEREEAERVLSAVILVSERTIQNYVLIPHITAIGVPSQFGHGWGFRVTANGESFKQLCASEAECWATHRSFLEAITNFYELRR